MSSPFSIFRRYQKTLMVVLTVLAMFAFVFFDAANPATGQLPTTLVVLSSTIVLGLIMWLIGLRQDRGKEYAISGAVLGLLLGILTVQATDPAPVVATAAGDLGPMDIERLLRRRGAANRFLSQATIAAGVQRQPAQFGFGGENEARDVVTGYLLRQDAKSMGIEISDAAVGTFISRVTDDQLSSEKYREVLRELGVAEADLFDILRDELIARQAWMLEMPQPVATPMEYWDQFKKMNLQQELDVAPIPVAAFVDQIETPSDGVLRQFFEDHKSQVPNQTAEGSPGFFQPRRVRLAYLEADYEQFAESAPEISDEQIQKFYEANRDLYEILSLPESEMLLDEEMTDEPASAASPANLPPAAPSEPAPAETPDAPAAPAPEAAPEKAAPAEPKDGAEADNGQAAAGRNHGKSPFVLASFATQDAVENKATEPAATEPAAAEPTQPAAAPAAPAAPAATAPAPALGNPPSDDAAPEEPPAPRYRPLDENLKEEIREQLQREAVFEKMRALVDQAVEKMIEEGDTFAEVEMDSRFDRRDKTEAENKALDQELADARAKAAAKISDRLQAFAKENGMKYVQTEDVSAEELAESTVYNIGSAISRTADAGQGGDSIIGTLFAGPAVYIPRRAEDPFSSRLFAYWKTDDEEAHVPEFDDPGIKTQVLAVWKRVQARELAKQRAEELATAAGESDRPLSEVLADQTVDGTDASPAVSVIPTPRFSWLRVARTAPPTQMMFPQQRPELSSVPGVQQAGQDFMRTVFEDLREGETGVAPNFDRSMYYVVKVKRRDEIDGGLTSLRERFMSQADRMFGFAGFFQTPYDILNDAEHRQVISRWAEELEQRYDVRWADATNP